MLDVFPGLDVPFPHLFHIPGVKEKNDREKEESTSIENGSTHLTPNEPGGMMCCG